MKKLLQWMPLLVCGYLAQAQTPFSPEINPSVGNETLKLDCKFFAGDYTSKTDFVDVLAISGDCTVYDALARKFAPMKGSISGLYVRRDQALVGAKTDSSATVFMSIDKNQADAVLGDGGGLVKCKIKRQPSGEWKLVNDGRLGTRNIFFRNVDFREVGGTLHNQGFATVQKASGEETIPFRFLVAEDASKINSNKDLVGFSDTSDYVYPSKYTQATEDYSVIPSGKTVKRYQAMGWATQVDENGNVVGKIHRMGRGITAIVSAGAPAGVYGGTASIIIQYGAPAIEKLVNIDFPEMFKRVDDFGNETFYEKSQILTALRVKEDGSTEWVPFAFEKLDSIFDAEVGVRIPRYRPVFDSLLIAKQVAIRAGATVFHNVGDITYVQDETGENYYLISEKGAEGTVDLSAYKNLLAPHLKALDAKDGNVDGQLSDPYGRILAIPLNSTYKTTTLLVGGVSKTVGADQYFFSNPDRLEKIVVVDNNTFEYRYVVTVKENIPATTQGRNPTGTSATEKINEAYLVEYSSFNPYGLPFDFAENGLKTIPFEEMKHYMAGSKGAMLSSGGGTMGPLDGNLMPNSLSTSGFEFDTYFTVVNGYNGTDKSMVLAVRNIFPSPSSGCVQVGLSLEDMEKQAFTAWPNPTTGELHLSEVASYTLSDLTGSPLATYANTNYIDLTNITRGVYFLKKAGGPVKKIVLR
jgi:hypothetical protein